MTDRTWEAASMGIVHIKLLDGVWTTIVSDARYMPTMHYKLLATARWYCMERNRHECRGSFRIG
jgi:hypothetical protein